MTLDEFIVECHADVDKFKAEWLAGVKATPDCYPLDLQPGDWFDQFLAFVGSPERG